MVVLHSIVWLHRMLYVFPLMIHKIPSFFVASAHNSQRVKNSELLWTAKTMPGSSEAITTP